MTENKAKNFLIGAVLSAGIGSYIAYKKRNNKIKRESLRGQVVVITGASEGIGKAFAIAFAKEGAKVILAARSKDKIEKLAKEIGVLQHVETLAVPTDVSKEEEARRLIDRALEHFGHIDILINNAGVGSYNFFYNSNIEDMRKIMEINYWGTVYCTHAVLPSMIQRRKGRIINVSSVVGKRGMPTMSGYCATKFAMQGLSESLRVELKKYGIGVTVICPTVTKTEIVRNALEKEKIKFAEDIGMSAERVAQETIDAVLNNKREHILGFFENILLTVNSNFPSLGDQVLTLAPKFMLSE